MSGVLLRPLTRNLLLRTKHNISRKSSSPEFSPVPYVPLDWSCDSGLRLTFDVTLSWKLEGSEFKT
jgi:hypothetical protein